MVIQTNFDIGERVWAIEKSRATSNFTSIDVLSGVISDISIGSNQEISYFFDEWGGADYPEECIIAYNDREELFNKIKQLDKEIREEKEV